MTTTISHICRRNELSLRKITHEGHFTIFAKDMALLKRHWCYVTGVTFCPCFRNVNNYQME